MLIRRSRAGRLGDDVFARAERYFAAMPLETHLNAYTVPILLERAKRYNLDAIDAQYMDLARVLGLPIATLDRGLRAAALRHGVAVFEPD